VSESFQDRLKQLRSEKGITQQQLASMMYITRSTISRWESGQRIPDLVLLPRLAECLGVDISQLIPDGRQPRHTPVVIIVDDEPPILTGGLNTLCEVLPGMEITGFTRPAEAIEYASHNHVDLAFLDIEMGKINGFEVCEKLLELNPSTNVIFLTAFPDYALDAWKTGARGFLVKPLDQRDVTELLSRLGILRSEGKAD
jgi:transcriptional regulator with XRE-family HTH domain